MITCTRADKTVSIKVEVDVPWGAGPWSWTPTIEFDRPWIAAFWIDAFVRQLGARLKSIRQRAYNRGWADAKAKRGKSPEYATTIQDI
jgi:hypothetical protein